MVHCPCGSQKEYPSCCGAFIAGLASAPTPEALMRSRYTAYSLANIDYIARTMSGPAAEGFDPQSAKKWAQSARWVKLEVLNSKMEGDKGEVSFKAHYVINHQPQVLAERSFFERIHGEWKYIDGESSAI